MSVTEKLARFICETAYRDLPAAAIRVAKMAMLDCLGVTLAGSTEPAAKIICDYVQELGAVPVASIVGVGLRTSATEAALANGSMAHALDYDDICTPISGHPSVALLPTVLALGETLDAPGKDVLLAYAVGFEAEARIGRAVNPSHYGVGWHATATLGTMGAAAAAAKLLGLSIEQTRMALGLAASQASGSRQNFGTMTKPFHAGNAARGGLLAALLVQKGLTADTNILDAPVGFCRLFTGEGNYYVDRITAGLFEQWELVTSGVTIKQYPCCGMTHAALDAMLGLITDHDLRPDEVKGIDVLVGSIGPQILIHNRPQTGLEGKFSMQFCLSVALVDRKVGLAQFTDERVNLPLTQDLIAKIQMVVDPGLVATDTIVRATLRDGRTVLRRVERAKGAPSDPLSDDAIATKYLDCAAVALAPEEAHRSLEQMQQLEMLPSVRHLINLVASKRPRQKDGRPR